VPLKPDFKPVLFKNRRGDRPATFDEYRQGGGYEALLATIGKKSPEEVVRMVMASGLTGRGGAGFPTGRKWAGVPASAPYPRYVQPNTDEMEPGTFKDRILVNADPHLVIEGIILCAYAVKAQRGIFFIRPSYESDAQLIERELAVARAAGFLGSGILGSDFSFELSVHRSAGRYICGEATAQVNAIQGLRPNPVKAPGSHLTEAGLWGRPTVVNNVETLASVPHILTRGPEWYKSLAATPTGDGTKLYCVSGKVARPGCYELPMGTRLSDIIYEHAGGMLPGGTFKACLPGGASTAFMPETLFDIPMDFPSLKAVGHHLGTASMIVFDKNTCLLAATINIIRFFVRESCGWCTPCREGLPVILDILERIEAGEAGEADVAWLETMTRQLHHAYCAFAPGAAAPIEGLLRHFRDEVMDHLDGRGCPFGAPELADKPGAWHLPKAGRP
jgi:NADH-quinone oxidoreductase subunit F